MNKFVFKDYFLEPAGKISKRMIYKSDNVIAFVLNIAKGETLPAHTHFDSTLLFQVMNGEAKIFWNRTDRAIRCGNNSSASVYDDRGILFLWDWCTTI